MRFEPGSSHAAVRHVTIRPLRHSLGAEQKPVLLAAVIHDFGLLCRLVLLYACTPGLLSGNPVKVDSVFL